MVHENFNHIPLCCADALSPLLLKLRFVTVNNNGLILDSEFSRELVPVYCSDEGIVVVLHLVKFICLLKEYFLEFLGLMVQDTGILVVHLAAHGPAGHFVGGSMY